MTSPYLNISTVCRFPSCRVKYLFRKEKEVSGRYLSKKKKNAHIINERGRNARALHEGVSQLFHSKLKENHPLLNRFQET